jgi:hypothetical protein
MAGAAIVEDDRWPGELHGELRARLAIVFCQARSRMPVLACTRALLTAPGGAPLVLVEQPRSGPFDFRLCLPKAWCADAAPARPDAR